MKPTLLALSVLLVMRVAVSAQRTPDAQLDSAQTDACWREPYPSFPRQWASNGRVIEANNLFQGIAGATIVLNPHITH
jgi:hypothetical protein